MILSMTYVFVFVNTSADLINSKEIIFMRPFVTGLRKIISMTFPEFIHKLLD